MSWTAGGGAGSPEHGSAAVSSPGKTNPALPGSARGSVWPWSTAVACVMHWRPQGGGSGLGRGSSTARAARRPRSLPELGAWVPRGRQGLLDLAQRDQGAREVLTGARNRVERPCRGGGVKGERRRRFGVRGGVVADGVRAPGLQRSTCDVPVKQIQGLARHGGVAGGEGLRQRWSSPAARSAPNSGDAVAQVRC